MGPLDPNFVAVSDGQPAVEGDASGASQTGSSWNWNEFINTLGNTATGLWGNNPGAGGQQPSAPPMVFQSNNSNTTLWVVLIVLVLAAIATIYLIKKK